MLIILEQYNCWQVTTSTYIYTFWNFIAEFGGWFGLFLGEESIILSTVQYALNHYYAKIQVHHKYLYLSPSKTWRDFPGFFFRLLCSRIFLNWSISYMDFNSTVNSSSIILFIHLGK